MPDEVGWYSVRRDPTTGAPLVTGRCAGCGGPVGAGEASGLWYVRGGLTEALAQGLHHLACGPKADRRYVREYVT